jgi:hypothetical protein
MMKNSCSADDSEVCFLFVRGTQRQLRGAVGPQKLHFDVEIEVCVRIPSNCSLFVVHSV